MYYIKHASTRFSRLYARIQATATAHAQFRVEYGELWENIPLLVQYILVHGKYEVCNKMYYIKTSTFYHVKTCGARALVRTPCWSLATAHTWQCAYTLM